MSLKVNGKAYDWGDVNLQIPGIVAEVRKSWCTVKAPSRADMETVITRHPGK